MTPHANDANPTVNYVQALQTPEGGFRSTLNDTQPSIPATLAAVRVLGYLGGDIPDRVACEDFVRNCVNPNDGGIAYSPNGPTDVYSTAVGTLALVDLVIASVDDCEHIIQYLANKATKFDDVYFAAFAWEAMSDRFPDLGLPDGQRETWIAAINTRSKGDGTYGLPDQPADVRTTADAVAAKIRFGAVDADENYDSSEGFLRGNQNQDGGYGPLQVSDIATTYEVMRAFDQLRHVTASPRPNRDWPLDADKVIQYAVSCRNDDGGYGKSPGDKDGSAANPTYFAVYTLGFLSGL